MLKLDIMQKKKTVEDATQSSFFIHSAMLSLWLRYTTVLLEIDPLFKKVYANT